MEEMVVGDGAEELRSQDTGWAVHVGIKLTQNDGGLWGMEVRCPGPLGIGASDQEPVGRNQQ